MAQIRFTASDDACTVFGVTFAPGEWLDAATLAPEVVAALSVNPTFQYRAGQYKAGEYRADD